MAKAKSKGRKGKQAKLSKGKKRSGKKAAGKRKGGKKKKAAKRKAAPRPTVTRAAPAPAFTEIAREEFTLSAPETPEEPMMGSTDTGSSESSFSTSDDDNTSM
jgi:hypothetical protein